MFGAGGRAARRCFSTSGFRQRRGSAADRATRRRRCVFSTICRAARCTPAALAELAARLGADVPACLAARPVWVGGIGERLEPAEGLPPAGIVLANSRIALPTQAVFRERRGPFSEPGRLAAMPRDAPGLAAALASRRNDLTEAALRLVPEIAAVLERLAGLPGALLARMSGSGATCFALFADRAAALAALAALRRAEPEWWSAAGALLTQPPPIEALDQAGRPTAGMKHARPPVVCITTLVNRRRWEMKTFVSRSVLGALAAAAMLLPLTAVPASAQVPGGSYLQSCRDAQMRGDRLVATCRTEEGRWSQTALEPYRPVRRRHRQFGRASGLRHPRRRLQCRQRA